MILIRPKFKIMTLLPTREVADYAVLHVYRLISLICIHAC